MQVALALGGACTLMAALLHRSNKQNARLAALLARRETDFSNLVRGAWDVRALLCGRGRRVSWLCGAERALVCTPGCAPYGAGCGNVPMCHPSTPSLALPSPSILP